MLPIVPTREKWAALGMIVFFILPIDSPSLTMTSQDGHHGQHFSAILFRETGNKTLPIRAP